MQPPCVYFFTSTATSVQGPPRVTTKAKAMQPPCVYFFPRLSDTQVISPPDPPAWSKAQ